jgi:hypothetical protein
MGKSKSRKPVGKREIDNHNTQLINQETLRLATSMARQKAIIQTSKIYTACIIVVLNKLFKFGPGRIQKVLTEMEAMLQRFTGDPSSIDQLKQELAQTGMEIDW